MSLAQALGAQQERKTVVLHRTGAGKNVPEVGVIGKSLEETSENAVKTK